MPVPSPFRLGFLVDSLLSHYQVRMFQGAKRMARERGVQLVGFQGSYLTDAERPVFDGSFLYDLAGPDCVDGLIVASNVLASSVGAEAVQAFCARTGLPVVSIGKIDDVPHVDIDNAGAISAMVDHLVESHGRRRFAFIQGPAANPESITRESAFRARLRTLGLPIVEDWVLPGTFFEASGARAIRILIDERKIPIDSIDAIVAANDQMAAGATRELAARGVRVGIDIAVVGFDDDEHARSNDPPLTTVAQPVERMGARAVEMLLDRIAGRAVAACSWMPAELTWRRSCGCGARPAMTADSAEAPVSLELRFARITGTCLERLQSLLDRSAAERGLAAALHLLQSSEAALARARDEFEAALIATSDAGFDPLRWLDALIPIEEEIERHAGSDANGAAELRARLLGLKLQINEIAARRHMLEQLHVQQRANAARVLGSSLVCTRNLRSLGRVLQAGLASLEVRYCCVCLFEPGNEQTVRVAAHYDPVVAPPADLLHSAEELWRAMPKTLPPSQSPPSHPDALLFAAKQLLHPETAPSARRVDLLVYPLVFAEDALGYVVFDAPEDIQRAWLLEGLAGHLSSALYALIGAEELRRARELAEKASAAKSEFVAMMSHEVRTPLTAILGHVDLCLQTHLTRDQRRHLTRTRTSSRALLAIVNDILDFSKIEARRLELESVQFDLDELLDQVIGTCAAPAARKGLELVVDVDNDAPRWLTGDPLRLSQVLLNLVGNAVKFSEHGDILLRVAVVALSAERAVLRFAVSDTGIGMSPEQVSSIFRPFTQADSSISRRYGGTGLGLTISQRLVELMQSELAVESELGRGSTFSFAATFPGPHLGSAGALGGARRALIVQDHALQAQALERLLVAQGFCVEVVHTARAALASSEAAEFEVVFADYRLPDMDGLDLARRLASGASAVRPTVVLISPPMADFLLNINLVECGVSHVISKPILRANVLATLRGANAAAASTPPLTSERATPAFSLHGRKILLVQDSEVTRELVKQVLESAGAEVETAVDGVEAVERGTSGSYALIVMDLHLPILDGCAAARLLRDDPRSGRVPILGLTASALPHDRERCIAAGMRACLGTPIDANELVRAVAGCLDAPELRARSRTPSAFTDMPPSRSSDALRVPFVSGSELDVGQAMHRLGGDAALYRRLLRRFASAHQGTALEVRRALDAGNVEDATLTVHATVSAAANIGASRMQHVAQALESALRRTPTPSVQDLLAEFEHTHGRCLASVAAVLEMQPSAPRPPASPRQGEIVAALQSLRSLLEEHDTAAIDCVQALGDLLADPSSCAPNLHLLEASIGAYDFERARQHLETFTDWLTHRALVGRESQEPL